MKKSNQRKIDVELFEPEGGMFFTYANHLQIGFTHFDVRLVFGEVVDVRPKQRLGGTARSGHLSWGQAKLLHHMLGEVVKNFEATQGEITLPEGMTDLQDLTRKPRRTHAQRANARACWRAGVRAVAVDSH